MANNLLRKVDNMINKIRSVFIILLVFIGCDNGTTSGESSFQSHYSKIVDNGRTIIGIPYSEKEDFIYTAYNETFNYSHYLISDYSQAIDIISRQFGPTSWNDSNIMSSNLSQRDNWVILQIRFTLEGIPASISIQEFAKPGSLWIIEDVRSNIILGNGTIHNLPYDCREITPDNFTWYHLTVGFWESLETLERQFGQSNIGSRDILNYQIFIGYNNIFSYFIVTDPSTPNRIYWVARGSDLLYWDF